MSEQQVIADLIRKMHDRIDEIHVISHTVHDELLHEIQEFKKNTQSINDYELGYWDGGEKVDISICDYCRDFGLPLTYFLTEDNCVRKQLNIWSGFSQETLEDVGIFFTYIDYRCGVLLGQKEIFRFISDLYPGSSAWEFNHYIHIDLSSLQPDAIQPSGIKFKNCLDKQVKELIALKYSDQALLNQLLEQHVASPVPYPGWPELPLLVQEFLINLGVVTSKHANKLIPEAVEILLCHDVGL